LNPPSESVRVAVRVVPDGARPDLAAELPGGSSSCREHGGVEPVNRVVRDRDLILLVSAGMNAQHGAEDLVRAIVEWFVQRCRKTVAR